MNQEIKKEIVERCKPILKKYGFKATFSVPYYNRLNVNINCGDVDFEGNYNKNWGSDIDRESKSSRCETTEPKFRKYQTVPLLRRPGYGISHYFTSEALSCLLELAKTIKPNHLDTEYHVEIHIGKYEAPYIYKGDKLL